MAITTEEGILDIMSHPSICIFIPFVAISGSIFLGLGLGLKKFANNRMNWATITGIVLLSMFVSYILLSIIIVICLSFNEIKDWFKKSSIYTSYQDWKKERREYSESKRRERRDLIRVIEDLRSEVGNLRGEIRELKRTIIINEINALNDNSSLTRNSRSND